VRPTLHAIPLLALLTLASGVASAGGVGARGIDRHGLRSAHGRSAAVVLRSRTELNRFTAEQHLRSAIELQRLHRELPRAVSIRETPPDGERSLERLRQRSQNQDSRDVRSLRVDLLALERRAGRPLGPETRRVFEAAIAREEIRRSAERDETTRRLREPGPAVRPSFGPR